MTVADLIRELQAMPNQSAPVLVEIDVSGIQDLGAVTEWAPIEVVRHEGPFVQLELG